MPNILQAFHALALGFAVAGLLATGYQAVTTSPASLRLIQQGPSFKALVAVMFLTFSAPFIIVRDLIQRRAAADEAQPTFSRFEFAMLATIAAGLWSLMSGTVVVMALRVLSELLV